MNIKNVTTGILALTIGISKLAADIGDGEKQIQAKYGNPVSAEQLNDTLVAATYSWDKFVTIVAFKELGDGLRISMMESFFRLDRQPLNKIDIEHILPSSTGGGKWIKRTDTGWQLGKKPIVARLMEDGRMIQVLKVE